MSRLPHPIDAARKVLAFLDALENPQKASGTEALDLPGLRALAEHALFAPDLSEDVLEDAEDFPKAVGNLVEKYRIWVSNNNSELGTFAGDVRRIADRFPA